MLITEQHIECVAVRGATGATKKSEVLGECMCEVEGPCGGRSPGFLRDGGSCF